MLSTNSIKAQSNLIDSLPVEKIDTVSIKIQNDSSLVLNNENNTEVDSAVVGVLTNDMDTSKKTKKQNKKDKKTDTKADKKNQETDTLAFSKQELKKSLKKELDSLWYSMYELSQEDTAILQNLITEKIESLEFALINTRKTDKKFALTDEFTEKALLLFDSADRNYISSDLWTSNNETHDNYTAKEYILDYFPRYAGQKNCWIDFDNVKIISFTQLDSGILNVIASFDSRQYPFKKETQTFREDKRLAYFIIDKNGSQWTAKIKYITYYQPYLYYQFKKQPAQLYLRKLEFDNKTIKESYSSGSFLQLDWSDSTNSELEKIAAKNEINLPKNIRLELYKGEALFQVISTEVASIKAGKSLRVPKSLPNADNYRIKISSTRNNSVYAFSKFFSIFSEKGDSTSPCETLMNLEWISVPTILTKNTTVTLKWNSKYVENINLYLVKGKNKKTRILNHKANTQKLNWRIPVGTATGKYRFLLIATDCPKMQIESQSVEVVKNEKERLAKKEEKREKRKEKRRKRKQ
ncbi:MAG: hypothetical protein COZ18_10965 [Flexibacter sp. CG_4_10_14_3_um_filter_32_15]|nr:MAG: hypothetical protein COZ18_10965 [Flexibacter sp. CG_4_10_14_3_um_filter_32_15]